jgi:hypothetical protein
MRSVTEFPSFKLVQGLEARKALLAEGKSAEEVQTALGEKFKLEGDKLKHFVNCLDVANANLDKLSRVMIVSLNEGETAPTAATKIEEHHYIPEFIKTEKPPAKGVKPSPKKDGKGGGKGKGTGPKSSPWGMTPEEKAAKKKTAQPKAQAKS